MIRYILIFILSLCNITLIPILSQSKYRFQSLGVDQGLTQNTINYIEGDNNGFVWISTQDGLNRYDGLNIVQFRHNSSDSASLHKNFVNRITHDKNGLIWFDIEKSEDIFLSIYSDSLGFGRLGEYFDISDIPKGYRFYDYLCDKNNNYWLRYKNSHDKCCVQLFTGSENRVFLNRNYISPLYEDKSGKIWSATQNEIHCFNSKEIKKKIKYDIKSNYFFFFEDSFGNLHFIDDGNIYRISDGPQVELIYDGGTNRKVTRFCPASNGKIWCGLSDGNICCIEGKSIEHIKLQNSNSNDKLLFRGLVEDNFGNVWFGSSNRGIVVYNKSSKQIDYIRKSDGAGALKSDCILCLYKHYDGTIWVGTYGGGVNIVKPELEQIKPLKLNGLSGKVQKINIRVIKQESENIIWFGSREDGLIRYNKLTGDSKAFNIVFEGKDLNIEDIWFESDTTLMLGTRYNGVVRYYKRSSRAQKIPYGSNFNVNFNYNYVRKIYKDWNNNILICQWGGLFKYNSDSDELEMIEVKGAPDNRYVDYMFDIIQVSDSAYFVGTESGILKIDSDGNLLKIYNSIQNNIKSLPNNTVFRFFFSKDGTLWCSTFGGGVCSFEFKTETFETYNTASGLANDCVFSINQDKQGDLWFSTNSGLSCFNLRNKSFKNYYTEDGLLCNSFNFEASCYTSDGMLYYGTESGVNFLNPQEIKTDTKPLIPVITDFNVFDSYKDFRYFSSVKKVVISPDEAVFSFKFVSPEYKKPNKLKYYYRIKELNSNWILSESRSALFSNLPYGDFTLQVKSEYNRWQSSPVKSVLMTIEAPFYKTTWFNIALIIIVALVLYIIYRYRIYNIKKIENLRVKIAGDLHDEIGSNLGSISIMSNIIAKESTSVEKRSEYSEKIVEISGRTADSMRDVIWFINPKNESSDLILMRMKEFVSTTLSNVKVDWKIDGAIFERYFNIQNRRNLYLVFKESVNNISKYSEATNVSVILYENQNAVIFTIEDDGVGFDTSKLTTGIGLRSLKKRAENSGGSFVVNSKVGEGTKIEIVFNKK